MLILRIKKNKISSGFNAPAVTAHPGLWRLFHNEYSLCRYRDSRYKDKIVLRPSYFYEFLY